MRDPAAPVYPTAVGGLLLVPDRSRRAAITLREIDFGSVAMDAVFRCVPPSTLAPRTLPHQREHRVVIRFGAT